MQNALGALASPWMKTKPRLGFLASSDCDSLMPALASDDKGGVSRRVLSWVGYCQHFSMRLCFEASERPKSAARCSGLEAG